MGKSHPDRNGGIGSVVAAVALVAVLGVGILIAAMLPGLGRDADPQAGSGQSSASASASAPSSRSNTPSPTRTTKPSLSGSPRSSARPPSLVPTRKATSAPTVRGAPTAAELRKAITSYYALMPGNTDQAWPRMTASYQANHAGGRQAYERFWDAIGRVVVSDVSGSPPGSAQATLTYYFKDGRVVTERTAYGLVNDGGHPQDQQFLRAQQHDDVASSSRGLILVALGTIPLAPVPRDFGSRALATGLCLRWLI